MTRSASRPSSALKNPGSPSPSTTSRRTSQSSTTSPASKVSFQKEPPRVAPNISYCDISFDVPPGGKPMDEVRKILQQFIATINEIDDTAFVVQYNHTFVQEEGIYSINHRLLIPNEFSLPKFSSKLSLFFPRCKPKYNKTYTKVQFIHTYSLDDLISDIKDELSNHNFTVFKKALQHWDTSLAGWIVYFDPRNNPNDLVMFLTDQIKKLIKVEPIFAFRSKKVFNGNSASPAPKRSIIKKKNDTEGFHKAFHVETLNDQKAAIVSALRKIFASKFWVARYNIECKLTRCLDYFYDNDELTRNSNLLLRHSQVLANIGYVEAPGIVFVDGQVSKKLKSTPRQLIAEFKSSTEGFTDESLFISIERKWSGEYQLLYRKKFQSEAVRVAKHVAAHLHKKYGKDVLSMFTAHYQSEAKNCFWDSNDRPLHSEEKAAQDIIDTEPFAWLELPDDFSLNSNKRSRTDNSEVQVDDTSVLTSKTIDFLSPSQKEKYIQETPTSTSDSVDQSQTGHSAGSNSDNASMEGAEGHGEPSALGQ